MPTCPTVWPDTVTQQDPAPGTTDVTGPHVNLLVSLGPRPAAYVMPELVGLPLAEAQSKLGSAGLRLSKLSPVPAPDSASGTVVGQTPARGQRIDSNSTIELQVARVAVASAPVRFRACARIPGSAMAYAKIEIAPSILASNFAKLGEDVRAVEQGGADVIHVDVMDGHFVPNISIGIPVVASLHKATRLPLDVHLMIERPEDYIEQFVRAGASRVLIHQEATVHLDRALSMIRELGAQAGAAINPATPVATLTDVFDKVDTVLVMSVNPGFGGQKFIPGAVEKIRQLNQWRARYNGAFRIEVDGGVDAENTAELAQAGANTFVAGTSIFHTPDPAAAVRQIRKLATDALSQRV